MRWLRISVILLFTVLVGIVSFNLGENTYSEATGSIWNESKIIMVNGKKFSVRAVYVNLNSPRIKIRTVLGGGFVGGTEDLAAIARRYGAVAAINGTFFNSYSDMQPQGNIQIDGQFLHMSNNGTTVGFGPNNEVEFASLRTGVTGTTNGNDDWEHNWYAWGLNHIYTDASVIEIFTPAKGQKTGVSTGTSVLVKKGVVDSIVTGEAAIPRDGYVINFGPAANATKYVERFKPGTTVDYQVNYSDQDGNALDWSGIKHAIGAGPRLLAKGKVVVDARAEGFIDPKITTNGGARSAIGKTANNVLILATVSSATIPELALVMQKLGASEAMNLDGGASSGLYYKGSYLTKPGRKISNGILIFDQDPEVKIIINGQVKVFPVKAYLQSETTMVPMRGIFEALGAEVDWDGPTRTVKALKDNKEIQLRVDSKNAQVDGVTVNLAQPAVIKNSTTFVPLRFVSEALGAEVGWNGARYEVTIEARE